MKRFVHILKKIFFLPPFATVLIALPSFLFVIYGLVVGIGGVPAYLSYALSAYALVIVTTGVIRIARLVHAGFNHHPLVKKLRAHPVSGRYLTDATFRAEVSLYQSLLINILYAATKLISGILYASIWLITLAVYYLMLAVMRFLLLDSARKRRGGTDLAAEFQRYRICGVLLVFMNLALSGMIVVIIRQKGGYDYPGFLIYLMALYAFYTVITAAVNTVKFRKHGSPVLSAAKALSLTAALVSMLALETAMLSQFGSEDDYFFRQVMVASTGAGICGFIFVMAVYMVVRATRQLRELEIGKERMKNGGKEGNICL